MYSKRVRLFFVVFMLIFLSVPIANFAFRIVNRASPEYVNIFEAFKSQWSLDLLEGNLALTLLQCCERSLHPEMTVVGQDGYFFLGNRYNKVLDRSVGTKNASPKEISLLTKSAEQLMNLVRAYDGTMAFVIAPNKHSIYPEKLPADLNVPDRTQTDDIIEALQNRDVPTLDLRQPLRAAKEKGQVYELTGTHWTRSGGALAYEKTMAFLSERLQPELQIVDYELNEVVGPSLGLMKFLKVNTFSGFNTDVEHQLTIPLKKVCIATTPYLNQDLGPCLLKENYEASVTAPKTALIKSETETAPNDLKVLMLCDSFCTAPSTLWNASFSEVHRAHWDHLSDATLEAYIENVRPDLVILQIAERNLDSWRFHIKKDLF